MLLTPIASSSGSGRLNSVGGRFNRFGQYRAHPRGGVSLEAVDHEHALDHVGGDVRERPALQLHGDHRAARIAAERAAGPGEAGRAPERRHHEPGGPRRGPQATSRLTEEESARFHTVSIPWGYDSHAGAG
jgi:hypothetical protein